MKFTDLGLNSNLLKTVNQMGFEEPTPIQQQAIPVALEGRDLIGQAQTGTGKTAAFGLPMLQGIDPQNKSIQGLVIAPTRELAIQVQEEIFRLGREQRARVFVVYGGSPIRRQIQLIQRNQPQIIVGTPGRIIDLMNRKVLKFDELKTAVLDEADEMLNMGFIDDIRNILNRTPKSRQTLLFSATMPKEVKQLSRQFLKDPVHVQIKGTEMTADLIDQYYIKARDIEKFDILTRLLETQQPKQAIIFCRTKKRVDEIGRALSLRGFNAELIHGDITQQKRTSVIREFRDGQLKLLVATDVAARGLDISGVTHVYNYDIPQDPESYVHRIGRTGRAGSDGQSITFVIPNEMDYLRTIEKLTRRQMTPLRPPTSEEAQLGQIEAIETQVSAALKEDLSAFRQPAEELLEKYGAEDLVASLLSQIIQDATEIEVSISPQRPLPQAKQTKRHRQPNRRRRRNRSNRRGNQQKNRRHQQERKSNQQKQQSNRRRNRRQNRQKNQKDFKIR